MRNCPPTSEARSASDIGWTENPVENIEIAKRLITAHPDVDIPGLMATAGDRSAPHSARIAAIYTLGFTDDAGASRVTLARLIGDAAEPDDARDHAVETLDSITSSAR